MPNYCNSLLTITGDCSEIQAMEEQMFSVENETPFLDFNKVVPMPNTLNITSGGYVELASSMLYPNAGYKSGSIEELAISFRSFFPNEAIQSISLEQIINLLKETKEGRKVLLEGHLYHRNLHQYNHHDWYSWRREHWSTKWNVTWFERVDLGQYRFDTAWNPPIPVIEALSVQYPKLRITLVFAELGCQIAGIYEWFNGELSFSQNDCDVEDIAQSYFGYEKSEEED